MDNAVKADMMYFKQHYDDHAACSTVKLTELGRTKRQPAHRQTLAKLPERTTDFIWKNSSYQFGRYLLIASLLTGNMPANSAHLAQQRRRSVERDHHNNINIQMNHWPACSTNLYERTSPRITLTVRW